MREILFRGKPKNEADYEFLKKMYKDNCKDGFIYGSLVISHGKYYICIMALCQINSLVNNGTTTMFEVIPETVGQYTGLKDKNGKRIFEGDIVRTQPFSDKPYSSKAKYKQHIGVVEYKVRHFKNRCYEQDYDGKWIVKIGDYGNFYYCDWNAFFKCEVIGNIYDNPELLKG